MKNKLLARTARALAIAIALVLNGPHSLAARVSQTSPTFSLADYLKQVEGTNDDFRAAEKSSLAANMYVKDARIALMPTLFASASHTEDRRLASPLGLQIDKTTKDDAQIGVSQTTDFGLNGKLYYGWNDNSPTGIGGFAGLPISSLNVPMYYEAHPTIELTFSLWRNWLGGEVTSAIDETEARAKIDKETANFKLQQVLLEAEAAYWNLVLAREAVGISKGAVARTQQIDDWTRRRANLQLADRSDYLQSQASVKLHRVDLRSREDEERAAILAFNKARGEISLAAPEKLEPFNPDSVAARKQPIKGRERGDVAIAREQAHLAKASARTAIQRDLPTVELYGTYALNSQSYQAIEAFNQSTSFSRPTQIIGLRLSMPLALGALSEARQGHAMQEAAADLNLRRRAFDQERDWDNLAQKYGDAQERLALFHDLETAQREKLTYERERQKRGRTTMQQVLLFEIDYENAQLSRIRTLSELNQLNAQMKQFGVTYESR